MVPVGRVTLLRGLLGCSGLGLEACGGRGRGSVGGFHGSHF